MKISNLLIISMVAMGLLFILIPLVAELSIRVQIFSTAFGIVIIIIIATADIVDRLITIQKTLNANSHEQQTPNG